MQDDSDFSDPEDLIRWAVTEFPGRLALVTSFQQEGMVILDMALRVAPQIPVFTLDTGRLPESTYRMIESVRSHYGITINMITPAADETSRMTSTYGPNLFREDLGSRLLCCQVRKVRPLANAMSAFDATLVGLRREQSETRSSLKQINRLKTPVSIAPLAAWTSTDVSRYTALHSVPEHPLYLQGYRSIGCDPCTRAVQAGEDERSGRWWWENDAAKECGLHFTPDGRAQRRVDVLLDEVLRRNA